MGKSKKLSLRKNHASSIDTPKAELPDPPAAASPLPPSLGHSRPAGVTRRDREYAADCEQRTAFARSVRGKSPLSPLPPGSPRTRSRLAAQRLENEFRRDDDDD